MAVRDGPLTPMTRSGHCTFGTPPAHNLCKPEKHAWTCSCDCHKPKPKPQARTIRRKLL